MPLLDAPDYNTGRENLKRNLLVGTGITFVLLILLTLAGYISGHGWLFSNLPAEHKVDKFFTAVEAKDFDTAYAIYTNDAHWQQNPAAHKDYPIKQFTEDWTTASPIKEPILKHHVDLSRTDGTGTFGTGIIVAVTLNGSKRLFMWVQRSDGTLTEPAPHEILY